MLRRGRELFRLEEGDYSFDYFVSFYFGFIDATLLLTMFFPFGLLLTICSDLDYFRSFNDFYSF